MVKCNLANQCEFTVKKLTLGNLLGLKQVPRMHCTLFTTIATVVTAETNCMSGEPATTPKETQNAKQ